MTIEDYFSDIADAIRERGSTSAGLTPAQMPQAILDIPGGGGGLESFQITVTGGYNGGAIIKVYCNGTVQFSSTGDSPYNLHYTPEGGSISGYGDEIIVTITPPANNTSPLNVSLSNGVTYSTGNIMPDGANTSYGYNYDSGSIPVN